MNPVSATSNGVDFEAIRVERPEIEHIAAIYRRLRDQWEGASDAPGRLAAFAKWDALRRDLANWTALTKLCFDQNTSDLARKAEREYLDALSPKLTALETEMQRLLLASPHRADLNDRFGSHLLTLWEADVTAFAPAIEADLTRELNLESHYTELIAGARLPIDGTYVNFSGIEPYAQSTDRALRHRAQRARDAFFGDQAEEFDRTYDELVRLRHAMAGTLGFENFVGLGYKRMHRVDFDQADVERYREEVRRHIVPIASDIIKRRAKDLGVSEMMFWDETMASSLGNPVPKGDLDWVVARGQEVLRSVHPEIGDFYAMMIDHHLVDLRNREGKAGGGYCTSFPADGVPFVFANFNGTHGDVYVLIHEMGHAFQDWKSRKLPAFDYLSPSAESAEIHSMSIGYLALPFMERFFGADAERYRRLELEDALLFLPYGVAIDHFQHLVYAVPQASPAQRHEMWREMEARYLPWRRYGDLTHFAKGGLWQAKPHIYEAPFYYIDYTLALCCALQFWVRSRQDYQGAVADYVALCARGGEAPFQELVRSAHLASPFASGVLAHVAREARAALIETPEKR